MKKSTALNKTADELEKRNWIRGNLADTKKVRYQYDWKSMSRALKKDKECGVCALGAALAVSETCFRTLNAGLLTTVTIPLSGDVSRETGISITWYNDNVARDKREVVRALRKEAKMYISGGE